VPFIWAETASRAAGARGALSRISRPVYQRFGQLDGMAQLLDDDDRDEAPALEIFDQFQALTLDFATTL
jgi:hypothetical protein